MAWFMRGTRQEADKENWEQTGPQQYISTNVEMQSVSFNQSNPHTGDRAEQRRQMSKRRLWSYTKDLY